MSYPDEDEARVEGMLADLAAAGALPPSIKLMNDAVIDSARRGTLFPEPLLARALLAERDR